VFIFMMRLNRALLHDACDQLAQREPPFSRALREFGYPPLLRRTPGFATLVKIILEQQVSLSSAQAVFDRLARVAGEVSPASILSLPEEALRNAGLTRQKARYCRELAAGVDDGSISFTRIARAADGDARHMLLQMTGVGEWTADVYLLFVARRPDIWPPGDVALIRSLAEVFDLESLPTNQDGIRLAENFRPWRSAAARMLWHAYLSRRGRQAPAF
jgi:DNA-3-methyladenine glycosylase II